MLTGLWFGGKYAPEIVSHDGQDYVAGYSGGILMERLIWVPMKWDEASAFAAKTFERIDNERAAAEKRRGDKETR
jgi:hypothetical protein